MLNEADTRAKLIDPKLYEAGWDETRIEREHPFTKGRIYLVGDEHRRKEPKKADYILRYADSLPIAVVEAKDESHAPGDGMQQAKSYAEILNLLFAYSTNGRGIEEFDFATNEQRTLTKFPSPDELWERYETFRLPADSLKAAEARGKYVATASPLDPLLYPYFREAGGKVLWYFQEIAIKNVIERILKGDKGVLLTMATGTGKTFVAFQIAWKLVKSKRIRKVLFLADRNVLRDQAYNTFGPFEDARALIEEGKAPKTRDIYFSIYQAMYSGEEGNRLYKKYPPDFFDLIIIDECHRSGYGTWNAILKYFNAAIQLGMTATPKRDENIDTYKYFCQENDGNPAFIYSLGQGIDDGFLATYKVHKVKTNIDRDGLHIEDAKSQGAEILCPADIEPRDYYQMEQFEREIVLPDRTAQISDHLASLLKTFDPMRKTMVFCVNMDHARDVAKNLQNHFSFLGFPDYAVRIVSEESEAKTLLEQFSDSEKQTPVVATTVDLLTTGVDVPSVQNIVFIKPVASQILFKQIVGRGSRICSDVDKFWFRIIDYTNATRLFDDWDRPPNPPKPPKIIGPRDQFFQGVIVGEDSYLPVANTLVTLLIAPNEQVQQRTDPSGNFAFSDLPQGEIKVIVSAQGYRTREVTLGTFPDQEQRVQIEMRPIKREEGVPKIRVEGIIVNIAEETYLELEPTGQRLTVQQYIDHTKKTLKAVPSFSEFQEIWADAEKRRKFIFDLKEQGIYPDALSVILNRRDADNFDILASLGFDKEIISRGERAASFENLQQRFLNSYRPEALTVLRILLDKYQLAGIEEISPEAFRVAPFDKMGYAPGVAKLFSGPDKLRQTLAEMQRLLYVSREAE